MYAIKVRRKGERAWWFLSGNAMNRLRIHATRFGNKDHAEWMVRENAPRNPEHDWKVVRLA